MEVFTSSLKALGPSRTRTSSVSGSSLRDRCLPAHLLRFRARCARCPRYHRRSHQAIFSSSSQLSGSLQENGSVSSASFLCSLHHTFVGGVCVHCHHRSQALFLKPAMSQRSQAHFLHQLASSTRGTCFDATVLFFTTTSGGYTTSSIALWIPLTPLLPWS